MIASVFFDGGCAGNPGPGACAAVVVAETGEVLLEDARALGHVTNNIAEYRGLLLACSLAMLLGVETPHFFSDSMIVVQQVNQWWAIRNAELGRIHSFAASALMRFDEWTLSHVPRAQNERADWLCNQLLDHKCKQSAAEIPGIQFRKSASEPRPGWANLPRQRPSRSAVATES